MRIGRRDAIQRQVGQPPISGGAQREGHGEALLHRWGRHAVGHAAAVGLVRERLMERRAVVRASGMVPLRQGRRPWAHQRHAAPEHGTGRAPRRGGDVRRWEQAPAAPHGDRAGVTCRRLGLAAVDGLHGQGVAQDAGQVCAGTQVSEPGPREACHAADARLAGGARACRNGSGAAFLCR